MGVYHRAWICGCFRSFPEPFDYYFYIFVREQRHRFSTRFWNIVHSPGSSRHKAETDRKRTNGREKSSNVSKGRGTRVKRGRGEQGSVLG